MSAKILHQHSKAVLSKFKAPKYSNKSTLLSTFSSEGINTKDLIFFVSYNRNKKNYTRKRQGDGNKKGTIFGCVCHLSISLYQSVANFFMSHLYDS